MPISSPPAFRHSPDHAVQFYRDKTFLCATVAAFIADGLASGQPAVIIATPAHCTGITGQLRAIGIDVDDARRTGDLVVLDAAETLATFMVDDRPDAGRFRGAVVPVVQRLLSRYDGSIRAYGEMVDLLWRDGNPEAAIRLEVLWNDLAATYPFSLLCGYAVGNFYKQTQPLGIPDVCRQHSEVLQAES